jgi:hypothetical protein
MRVIPAVLCLVALSAFAQDASKEPPLKVTGVQLVPETAETPQEKEKEAARQAERRASLGDSIIVTADPAQLTAYLDYAAKQSKSVTLYINGNDTGIAPEGIARSAGRLQFHLERTAANKALWSSLLRHPFIYQVRLVNASVGIPPGPGADSTDSNFKLVIVNWAWYAWAWLILLLLVLIWFGYLTKKKGLLLDVANGPYSLGRCQMAWWFFLIIISYVMIWLISGDRDTISPSLLGLMGISAGTALGAVLIDTTGAGSQSLQQASADVLALQVAETNAQKDLDAAQAAVTANPGDAVAQKQLQDAKAALAAVQARLADANSRLKPKAPKSNGFVRDILGDSDGNIGLHRFQMVLWTIVLGIMFVVGVMAELTMPEFNATLLATMGISAGTYLGFKFPEK